MLLRFAAGCVFFITTMMPAASMAAQQSADQPEAKSTFTIEQTDSGLVISVNGKLFANYVVDQVNKPYLWPVIGPGGHPMTRAYPMQTLDAEPKSQRDHPHHRGILFGHESVGKQGWKFPQNEQEWDAVQDQNRSLVGGDTWHEEATFAEYRNHPQRKRDGQRRPASLASIQHRRFSKLTVAADHATFVELCDHVDRDGKRFLTEQRTVTFRADQKTRTIEFDQVFTASDGSVVFGDRKDAGLAIRVPALMAVDSDQGGKIVNSEGQVNAAAWSQPAKWCDYHGPVDGQPMGIAILNHPNSFRFPTRWHVRNYGLFAANPFGSQAFSGKLEDGSFTLEPGKTLTLKHRFVFHFGDAESADIESAWQNYARQ